MVADGVGDLQTLWVFGGTSELALASIREICKRGVSRVVLLCRDIEAGSRGSETLQAEFRRTEFVVRPFDGSRVEDAKTIVEGLVADHGDVDVALIAHAVLGRDIDPLRDPDALQSLADVNFTGAIVLLGLVARQMAAQRYGRIVLFSSVAAERVRRVNIGYGATKAGLDAFAQGLDHLLAGTGASILVVRPGFVRTKMTAGMPDAPLSTTPEKVGRAVADALRSKKRIIWVPGILRYVFSALRHLPTWVWRRLPI